MVRPNMCDDSMARIRICLAGHIKEIVGQKDLEVDVDSPTIFGLIELLIEKYGEPFQSAVLDESSGGLRAVVVKNDREIDLLQGLATALEDGDRVMFIPPITGG